MCKHQASPRNASVLHNPASTFVEVRKSCTCTDTTRQASHSRQDRLRSCARVHLSSAPPAHRSRFLMERRRARVVPHGSSSCFRVLQRTFGDPRCARVIFGVAAPCGRLRTATARPPSDCASRAQLSRPVRQGVALLTPSLKGRMGKSPLDLALGVTCEATPRPDREIAIWRVSLCINETVSSCIDETYPVTSSIDDTGGCDPRLAPNLSHDAPQTASKRSSLKVRDARVVLTLTA